MLWKEEYGDEQAEHLAYEKHDFMADRTLRAYKQPTYSHLDHM
jgi:hypothetical protein